VTVFEEEVPTLRGTVILAMDGAEDPFAFVIGGPGDFWIVDIRGFGTGTLEAVDKNRSTGEGAAEFFASEPFEGALGHVVGALVFAPREEEVADQLGLVVAGDHAGFGGSVPGIGGAVDDVVLSPTLFLGAAAILEQVTIPEIAHGRHEPAPVIAIAVVGEELEGIACIHVDSDPPLFLITHAERPMRFGFGFGQCRQEHAGQDGDDCNYDEEFDEREGTPIARAV